MNKNDSFSSSNEKHSCMDGSTSLFFVWDSHAPEKVHSQSNKY